MRCAVNAPGVIQANLAGHRSYMAQALNLPGYRLYERQPSHQPTAQHTRSPQRRKFTTNTPKPGISPRPQNATAGAGRGQPSSPSAADSLFESGMLKSQSSRSQSIGIALRIEALIITTKAPRREVVVGLNAAILGGAQSHRGHGATGERHRDFRPPSARGSEVFH